MNRYEIAMDFKKKFMSENKNIWPQTMIPTYFAINGTDVKVSSNPYSFENSEYGLVIFHYIYTVISQSDKCIIGLFFNSNGEIEDFIEIDGWKLYFSKPVTAGWRCDRTTGFHITNGKLKLDARIHVNDLYQNFPRIWQLFSIIRTCETQKEVDFALRIYAREGEILSLKEKNLKEEAKVDALNILLEANKEFIEKLKELVNSKPEPSN